MYFFFDVDTWDDYKIIELTDRYGPLGFAIYNVILCEVYKNGYYLEIPLEQFAISIARTIGNRWIKNKGFVLQVIQYCAEIGLLDNALLSQSVITSAGIQQRYSEVTARSKADKSKYWLLEPVQKNLAPAAPVSAPETKVFAAETDVFAAKTPINAANIPQSREEKRREKMTAASSSPAAAAAAADNRQIEEAYRAATGRNLRAGDYVLIESLRRSGVSDAVTVGVIGDVAQRAGRSGGGKINSFRYFLPAIREAAEAGTAEAGHYPVTSDMTEIERILDAEAAAVFAATPEEDYDYDE